MEALDREFSGTARFRLVRRLGSGGMGTVYEAEDREKRTFVALKLLREFDAATLLRFKDEFRALQDLQHENLIDLGELIEDHGRWFLTMELIDGVDFLSYVRNSVALPPEADTLTDGQYQAIVEPGGLSAPHHGYDEARLRAALGQLASGLIALHGAQKVHRDVKPSNVLVTAKGRVVLLDFGLVADAAHPEHSTENQLVGTAAYMAPEQAASKPPGAPADWYAMGVMLYEALVGRLPFEGAPLEILINKQHQEPPRTSSLRPDTPPDLDALCHDLLSVDPTRRPSSAEIARRLGVGPTPSTTTLTPHSHESFFVGRERELGMLRAAYLATCGGHSTTVLLHGESGVGKSALLGTFCEELRLRDPQVLVLTGRCYERESVPYRGVDGMIDSLSRAALRMPKETVASLVPPGAYLLAQVFPVLRRVEAFARAPQVSFDALDPQELRSRLFTAIRELILRLSAAFRLVVVVDDVQWTDADSNAVHRVVMSQPGAPAALFIASLRTGPEGIPQALIPRRRQWEFHSVHVDRLSTADSEELAIELLSRAGVGSVSAGEVAREAGGHPLFLDELVRHVVSGNQPGEPIRLEDALGERIRGLDRPVREMLEVAAVAGTPLLMDVAARTAPGDTYGDVEKRISQLRAGNLLRTSSLRGGVAIECFHDRVQSAVLSHLGAAERRDCHRRIALAFEETSPRDADALAVHWKGAGDLPKASQYAFLAAEEATSALAFERAVRLYRLTAELSDPDGPMHRKARLKLADALMSAGRGRDAALIYLDVARDAAPEESLNLHHRAAMQLLTSGHMDEGMVAFRACLSALDMGFPRTPQLAVASLLFHRAQIRWRGLKFERRDARDVPERDLARIDVCWSGATGFGLVDPLRGADFHARGVLLALSSGEPLRVTRALALEAAYLATAGAKRSPRWLKFITLAEECAREIDHPQALGLCQGVRGMSAFQAGNWSEALPFIERAHAIFQDNCAGAAWELESTGNFLVRTLFFLGRLKEAFAQLPARIRASEERGNFFGAVAFRSGHMNLSWLARDDAAGARAAAKSAIRPWPKDAFFLQHWNDVLARAQIDLYVGDPAAAYRHVHARWPLFEDSLLTRVEYVRVEMTYLRGRAALAAALASGEIDRRLLEVAEGDARSLAREESGWARAFAALLSGGIKEARGKEAAALDAYDRAIAQFGAASMRFHEIVARRARGTLLGGEEGERLLAAADSWLSAQGIRVPGRFVTVLTPDFAALRA